MLFLAKDQANTADLLQLFHVGTDGFLVDAYSVEFRVMDDTGTQVYPTLPATYEDVTTTGYVSAGRYYAYDSVGAAGWSHDTAGLYRIDWKWTAESGGTEETWSQWFQIEEVSLRWQPQFEAYCSIQEFRDYTGVTIASLSNDNVARLIYQWQQYIDERCGQLFRPYYHALVLTGSGTRLLQLPAPVLGLESITMNGASSVSSSSAFDVFWDDVLRSSSFAQRQARNPRVKIKQYNDSINIWERLDIGDSKFLIATQQTVVGMYGFREPGNVCPPAITEAVIELLRIHGDKYGVAGLDEGAGQHGPITEEKTDIHTRKWANHPAFSVSALASGSARVEQIIRMYRRPMPIG